jgi:hypothetical protein
MSIQLPRDSNRGHNHNETVEGKRVPMHFRKDLIRLAVLLVASLGGLTPTLGQSGDLGNLCDIPSGKIQAVLSFKATRVLASQTSVRSFLAAWHERDSGGGASSTPGQLVVCEKNGLRYKEVFRFEDKAHMGFLEFAPLSSLTVPGLVVTFSSDIGWNGPTLVVALVQEKFEVVYQGATSELVDLDGNGIPEIFESVWPDGDGYPRRTTIHVWDGVKYRKLTTSRWDYRFSRSVLSRVRSYNKEKLRQNRK